ncbi:hypothetical protein [Chryseobacterium daeguense]|uniref:hypothetical protein n=1 Tax=Chryseobacterium daeguense TaxID=412438 RepID=UPI0003FE21F6|nr:hypothetical protein [Chryseobacterium daeguense]
MSTSILLKDSLLLIWNNRNAAERLILMDKIYSSDIKFYEDNNSEPITGHESINNLIQNLQKDWPSDFEFTIKEDPKINHNLQKISWHLGSKGSAPVAAGTDIALIKNGKIESLYLFLETK